MLATLLANIPFAMQGYRFAGFKAAGVEMTGTSTTEAGGQGKV